MIELPEAAVLARQINETMRGKRIQRVVAAQSPHKFAWYKGDPEGYPAQLEGKIAGDSVSYGGQVVIEVEDTELSFSDGVNLRFHRILEGQPEKHQLLLEFDDSSALSASVAMYGGLLCCPRGTNDNPYYLVAKEKPSPLTDEFTYEYFTRLFQPETEKMPLKGFLATQQRIPGLGNGVLQDILYTAHLHPKRKVSSLDADGRVRLFEVIQSTLGEMANLGGRDTERDLYGLEGNYSTRMSKNTAGKPCNVCGELVRKESYMGGSIYFCPSCQTTAYN